VRDHASLLYIIADYILGSCELYETGLFMTCIFERYVLKVCISWPDLLQVTCYFTFCSLTIRTVF